MARWDFDDDQFGLANGESASLEHAQCFVRVIADQSYDRTIDCVHDRHADDTNGRTLKRLKQADERSHAIIEEDRELSNTGGAEALRRLITVCFAWHSANGIDIEATGKQKFGELCFWGGRNSPLRGMFW